MSPGEATEGATFLAVIDGATYKKVWFYQVPRSDSASPGGLQGVSVATDLTGDGTQDILAYRGTSVFIFNGADGLLIQPTVDGDVTYLAAIKVGADSGAVLAATDKSAIIMGSAGDELWKSAYADWGDVEAVWPLDDFNDDNIDDLAIILSDRVVIAKSDGFGSLQFAVDYSVHATASKIIVPFELVDDMDGDGVSEVAYFEYDEATYQTTGKEEQKVLLIISPVSGDIMLEVAVSGTTIFDLGSADFDGDGFVDSLVYWAGPRRLQVFSGGSGGSLFTYDYTNDVVSTVDSLPAVPVADVTGDEIADLAIGMVVEAHGQVLVYDIAAGLPVKKIMLPYPQRYNHELPSAVAGPTSPGRGIRSVGGLNGDTYAELAVLDRISVGTNPRKYYIALIDAYGERLHAYFPFSDLNGLFDAATDGTQGIVADGGVYLLSYDGGLQIAAPTHGTAVRSPASIAWEGAGPNDFVELFVDNIRQSMVSGTGVALSLRSGGHDMIIRAIDESGKITYAAVSFTVRASSWVTAISFIMLALLLSVFFYGQWARSRRNGRAWKSMGHGQ